jgi:predicted nucleic acid-binding protein
MRDNCFIDTNILVYCYSNDEPQKRDISRVLVNSPNTIISTQVISEFANVLKKKFSLSWNEIELAISEIETNFKVHINLPETIVKACNISGKMNFSFYDSLILSAALESDCTKVYSEDLHDGTIIDDKLTIVNPFNKSK